MSGTLLCLQWYYVIMIIKTLTYFNPVFDSDGNNQTSSKYFDMQTCIQAARHDIDSGLVSKVSIEGDGETHIWKAETGSWS